MGKRLRVTARDEKGKGAAGRLRRRGVVPGVIYGRRRKSSPVQTGAKEIETAILRGERMVGIELDGKEALAILREVQYHPVTQQPLHFDLYEVAADQSVRVRVSIQLVGAARGVEEGGLVDQNVHDIEIECPAGRLPPHLGLDVSDLVIGAHLYASDIKLPESVRVVEDPRLVIVACHAPREEEEEEEAVAEEVAPAVEGGEPEVIGRKKEKEEPEAEEK